MENILINGAGVGGDYCGRTRQGRDQWSVIPAGGQPAELTALGQCPSEAAKQARIRGGQPVMDMTVGVIQRRVAQAY